MALWLLNSNSDTPPRLAEMLRQLTSEKIVSAQTTDEIIKTKPSLILSRCQESAELARTAEAIARQPELRLVPFLALFDDYAPWITPWRSFRNCPQLDGILGAPFSLRDLCFSIHTAYGRSRRKRGTLGIVGKSERFLSSVQEAVGKGRYWHQSRRLSLEEVSHFDLSVVVVELGAFDAVEMKRWRALLSAIARQSEIVGVGGELSTAFELRTFCHHFLAEPQNRREWAKWVNDLFVWNTSGWFLSLLSHHWKSAFRLRDFDRADTIVAQLRRICLDDARSRMILGEYYTMIGEFSASRAHFEASLRLNPFHPKTYWRLFRHLQTDHRSEGFGVLAQQFVVCCPNLPAIGLS